MKRDWMRPSVWSLRLALVLMAVASWGASAETTPAQDNAVNNTLVVTGIAHGKDGKPAPGIRVYVFPYNEAANTMVWKLGEDPDHPGTWACGNPSGKTGADGRFTIEFDRSFLADRKTHSFGVGTWSLKDKVRPIAEKRTGAVWILDLGLFDKWREKMPGVSPGRLDLAEMQGPVTVE